MSQFPPACLHDLVDRAADLTPDRPAVQDQNAAWSYAELRTMSLRFAAWLRAQGVTAGDRVLVKSSNSIRLAAMVFGTSRIGAVFVPVSFEMTSFHFHRIVRDAAPAVVLVQDSTRPDTAPAVFNIDEVWPDIATRQVDPVPFEERKHSTALLIYTSGSTALPKAVVCGHAQVLFAATAIAERLRYTSSDRVFLRLPMSFDYGLYQLFLCALAGASLYLAPAEASVTLLRDLKVSRATVVPVVPSLAQLVRQLAERRPGGLPPVRLFTNTGARLGRTASTALRQLFPGASVVAMFGITECKRVTIGEPDEDLLWEGSLGTPLPGTEVLIVDDDGRLLPAGETGQIVVRGPHVMDGYWCSPHITAERFRPLPSTTVPALHTGDFGTLDDRGRLHFHGRRDDIFKHRGVRVGATEIEAAAEDVPGVGEAVAFQPDPEGELWLVVTGSQTAETVLRALDARLEPAKRPDHCLVQPRLPLTSNGKVDRTSLTSALRARTEQTES